MLLQGIPGIKTREELREHIINKGCYSQEKNSQIYECWFATAPRYLFRAVDKKFRITEKVICDAGCHLGMNLAFCPPGSYGIEIEDCGARFASSIGLTIYQHDIINDDLSNLPKVEVVWCSQTLEHIDSIHVFLRKLSLLLKPDGLLVITIPTIPLFPHLKKLPKVGKYFSGHLASDHINAFTPSTIQFFCERAGFKTVEVSPLYPSFLGVLNHLPIADRLIDGCVYIGRKIEDWEYPEKATRRVAWNHSGFVFKRNSQ